MHEQIRLQCGDRLMPASHPRPDRTDNDHSGACHTDTCGDSSSPACFLASVTIVVIRVEGVFTPTPTHHSSLAQITWCGWACALSLGDRWKCLVIETGPDPSPFLSSISHTDPNSACLHLLPPHPIWGDCLPFACFETLATPAHTHHTPCLPLLLHPATMCHQVVGAGKPLPHHKLLLPPQINVIW